MITDHRRQRFALGVLVASDDLNESKTFVAKN